MDDAIAVLPGPLTGQHGTLVRPADRNPPVARVCRTFQGRRRVMSPHTAAAAAVRFRAPWCSPVRGSGQRLTSCQSWLEPPVVGHWTTAAPSAVEAPPTSAHQPVRTFTSRW